MQTKSISSLELFYLLLTPLRRRFHCSFDFFVAHPLLLLCSSFTPLLLVPYSSFTRPLLKSTEIVMRNDFRTSLRCYANDATPTTTDDDADDYEDNDDDDDDDDTPAEAHAVSIAFVGGPRVLSRLTFLSPI